MTKKQAGIQVKQQRFGEEFKQQALLRAAKDGVPAAACDLGLQAAQL